MIKKIIALFFVIALSTMLCIPTVSFAYGDTMPAYASGNRYDLVYIKRPESKSASTSDKTYTISAVGQQGTAIKVYKYNNSTGAYHIHKGPMQIGASGLYSVVVDLSDNSNKFKVYATNNQGAEQIETIEINKIKQSTVDRLKGVTLNIKNFFN